MHSQQYFYKDIVRVQSPDLKIQYPQSQHKINTVNTQCYPFSSNLSDKPNLGLNTMVSRKNENPSSFPAKIMSLPTEMSTPSNKLLQCEIGSMKGSLQLHSPKNANFNSASIASLSTQSSGNIVSSSFPTQSQKNQSDMIHNRNQRTNSQQYKPYNILEVNGFKVNQHNENVNTDSYLNPKVSGFSHLQPDVNLQLLQSKQINYSQRPLASSQLSSPVQNQQFVFNNDLGKHSKNQQISIENKQQQIRFASLDYYSQNTMKTEQKDNLSSGNNKITLPNSSQQQQYTLSCNENTPFVGRMNNFQSSNLFQKQQNYKPFNEFQQSTGFSEIRNNSLSNASTSTQEYYHKNNETNFSKSSQSDSQFVQDSISVMKKNELKNLIEAKQRELEQLQQISQSYRQNSIDSYKEINQKIKVSKQHGYQQKLHSTAKLNNFLINKFGNQNNLELNNLKQYQVSQQSS